MGSCSSTCRSSGCCSRLHLSTCSCCSSTCCCSSCSSGCSRSSCSNGRSCVCIFGVSSSRLPLLLVDFFYEQTNKQELLAKCKGSKGISNFNLLKWHYSAAVLCFPTSFKF